MKKLLRFGAIALFLSFAVSCSDDDSNSTNNDGNNAAQTISAVINGQDWQGTVKSATLIRVNGEQRFDISAEANGQLITISCSSTATTGSMPLKSYHFDQENGGDALFTNSYQINGNNFMEHLCDFGTVTLTGTNADSKTASGTFNFTSSKIGELQNQIVTPEDIVVTNGVFTNVKYVVYEQ